MDEGDVPGLSDVTGSVTPAGRHARDVAPGSPPGPAEPAPTAPMRLGEIDPRLRASALLHSIRRVDQPVVRAVTRGALRRWPRPLPDGVTVRAVQVGAAGLRVFEPDERRGGALLWTHGGGLVVGSARQDDGLCGRTAAELGAVVVSVDYRLAPEHPFPAALDDASAGWEWLVGNVGSLGVDPARLAIGGESAGGGLAASLVQRVYDQGGPQPVAQWLFAPMLDDRTAADPARDRRHHFVWNNRANRFGWSAYLQQPPGGSEVPPYASASRRRDLTGLPPTWIYTTELELFRDEDVDYARRLDQAGVDVELHMVSAAAHAFEIFEDNDPARRLLAGARAWLGERLAGRA